MKAFLVLCFVAAAYADKLGYNYKPVGHSGAGLSFAPGRGSIVGGNIGGSSIGGGSIGGGIIGGGNLGGGLSGPVNYNAAPATHYEKEFYTFVAPEDAFDDPEATRKIAASLKKSVRVIFIKGPENRGYENAVLALAKQAAEQKTAIYVLHKQPDIGDLANKFNAIRNNANNKPEVHFVKYRTPEDAANAQQQIQSQYDSLGGTSQSHNGGVAPVINFASQSQAPVRHQSNYASASSPAASTAIANTPESSYLPAAILRRLRLRI